MSKILRAGARPGGHTNSANTLMHASGCSFLLAVVLCDVCCQETMLQPYVWCETLAAIPKDNREKRKQNGFSSTSFQDHGEARPVSPGRGFFSNYFLDWKSLSQAARALLSSVRHAAFTKHCQSAREPVAAHNQILLEVIQSYTLNYLNSVDIKVSFLWLLSNMY